MKLILTFFLLLTIHLGIAQSHCDTLVNKIMMVGDSWSNFPVGFGSFSNNLDRYGFTNVGMYSNTTDLSLNGAETKTFLTPAGKTALQNAITANPKIEVVNLSIGGNDILNTWNNSMDSLTTDSLLDATMSRADSIIDYIISLKYGVKVYLAGYDFANFGEVIQTFSVPTSHPFYNRWSRMGFPTFIELNKLLTRASVKYQALANSKSDVYFNSTIGLMQYLYGQTTPLGVAPSGTYAPRSVTFPGGRLDYPTPKIMMNNYGLFRDCFHLSSEGFDAIYNYHFQQFYFDFLRKEVDASIVSEGSSSDGGVSSTGTTSTANINIGNSSSTGIFKGIVSFNTSTLPASTLIHRANIFLHRDNHTGTLPTFNQVILEVKQGNFGSTSSVEISDYNSLASKKDTACTYGTIKNNGFWLRIDVPKQLLTEINPSGKTQFRISMIDTTDGSTFYFSTGDSIHKPFLDLEFYNPASINSNSLESSLVIFPNPANTEYISLKSNSNFKGKVTAIDVTGRQFPLSYSNSQISISHLSIGTYFLIFENDKERVTKKFVKIN